MTRSKDIYLFSEMIFLPFLLVIYLTLGYTLLLGRISSATGVTINQTRERRDRNDPGICGSLDIRNHVHSLEVIRDCRVIEGFLHILLIEHANETDYGAYSFPELREITCYLLLYRVSGLKNLSQLFPNLSVIRGDELFFDYALVVYEMSDLHELGLASLTAILRGGVRIEKNRSLCYVDTIDWSAMHSSADSKGDWENFIAENEESVACLEKCPGCALSHCWTAQQCQRICPERCGQAVACDAGINGSIFCCHDECIGGCKGSRASDCVACRHVTHVGTCIPSCPAGTYRYLGRRCVSEQECVAMHFDDHPLERERGAPVSRRQIREEDFRTRRSARHNRSWPIPFDGECVYECPQKRTLAGGGALHAGACRKRCQGESVESIASAQHYRGCTHIEGSLEIELKGGEQVVRELEESLGQVEEISGYLKVVRSASLESLDFLRNLRVVQGKILESGYFAIVVLDNKNLSRIWDWDARPENLTVANGRLFFHFNPHLCPSEIEKLRVVAKLGEHTELEINSNGERGDCYEAELHAHIILRSPKKVTFRWQRFSIPKKQALLGYTIHYIEAPEGEAEPEENDPCGRSWHVEYVMDEDGSSDQIHGDMQEHNITNLFPFTQYAYYVKTYALTSEDNHGRQSRIQYFHTPPSKPTMPLHLGAKSLSESSILLLWDSPLKPNGNISYYQVTGVWQREDEAFLEQRDYCAQPANVGDSTHRPHHSASPMDSISTDKQYSLLNSTSETELKGTGKSDCCSSKKMKIDCKVHDYNYAAFGEGKEKYGSHACDSAMYNLLQNNEFYVGDEMTDFINDKVVGPEHFKSEEENYKMHEDGTIVYFNKRVSGLSHISNGLKNYGLYFFEVRTCRQPYTGEGYENSSLCSPAAAISIRTLPLLTADSVRSVSVFLENGSYFVSWQEPLSPNGAVLTYNIEYQRCDILNVRSIEDCITSMQYQLQGGVVKLQGLPDGEYDIRVRAHSLSGHGPFSGSLMFTVSIAASGSYDPGILWGSIIGVAIVITVFSTFIYILNYKHKKVSSNELKLIASVNPEYLETMPEETYVPDAWEVQRSKIKLLKEVGQGSFGMVYEGIMENVNGEHLPWISCAVKTVNEGASVRERIEFLNEATVMKAFHMHHVVKLLGVVSQGSPTLVVMELMAVGDLKTHLRKQRENSDRLPLSILVRMAAEVADGMAYLTSCKFVHRDLAARNCMVAADLTVKVGDFGMARDVYETDYYRKGTKGLLPVRWMAPESLYDGIFTCQSDVWSYGIVVWEMATLAAQPYQGRSNQEVLQFVIDGGIMSFPDQSPVMLNNIMRACWKYNPSQRPNFLGIVAFLEPEIGSDFKCVSFAHSEEAKVKKSNNK